jgi:hypothetical protein
MTGIISVFGCLRIIACADATHGPSRRDVRRREGGKCRVCQSVPERTESTERTRRFRVDELFDDCGLKGALALGFEEFVPTFHHLRGSPELRGKIKKPGMRYFGIALAAPRGAAGASS